MVSRRAALATIGGVAASAALAACGGGPKKAGPGPAAVIPTSGVVATEPPTTVQSSRMPLTGLPAANGANLNRPALSVKIDDAPAARPQAGLEHADVIFEEVVEGGIVRFMAVFHSGDAPLIGPVRSVRPVDSVLVTPLHGYFAYSGGADPFLALIRNAPVKLVGHDELSQAYSRRRGRPGPHNLYIGSPEIYAKGGGAAGPPPALFQYRAEGTPAAGAGATPAKTVGSVMTERVTFSWSFDQGQNKWLRRINGQPHMLENAGQAAVENVVLQFVPYKDSGVRDTTGAVAPEAIITGAGDALTLTGGAVIKGRWSRPGDGDVTTYTDQAGAPIQLTPGRTWVTLVPQGTQITVG